MSIVSLSEAILITDPKHLERLTRELQRETTIAVDTESNSLFAYRERVCLVQFSTPTNDFLVDPLALADLSPLGAIFEDTTIEKVFHAAEYDLICLKRDYGFSFSNLFDTMVAARTLGRPNLGLGAILEEEFGVQLDKRYQRANWGSRPIPDSLLDYARLDTHFLIPLRERLRGALQKAGLLALAEEDFQRQCAVNPQPSNGHPPACWRIKGAYDLAPQQAAVLKVLCDYREDVASAIDRPLFKILGDQTLLEIARQMPDSLEKLRRIPGMSSRQVHRHGARLLAAVREGLAAQPEYPPRNNRPSDAYLERLEAIRRWRMKAAQSMGVGSDVILPRDLLYSLASQNPHTPDELAIAMQDVPWRLEHFGEQILQVLKGK